MFLCRNDAEGNVALDELTLVFGGKVRSVGRDAIDVAQSACSSLVEHSGRIRGEEFAVTTGRYYARADVVAGIRAAQRVEVV